ncbi:MAG: phosphotransferase family protein [Candidatus Nanopelagicales bacterium]|jgi:aminoglycoside phosphotransferase (APT) family kinase protein|nr:phosphotransferase family protein [Actinomycetota bacterium]HNE89726.1 phosphotransferase family protein [Actinomycetota bacterium]HNO15412.1 phosphotransferase family protein [Actinomycetota bacterium]HUM86538.1 phosphotransferase family protein [Actinomycetota bacterium]
MAEMQVRDQDAFDVEQFGAWLQDAVPGLGDIERVFQFAGGASNLTFQIDCANDSVVMRTSPTGRKAASAHDMVREARLLTALRPGFDKVPEVLATAGEDSPIGRPLFISEYVAGTILRRDLPEGAPVEAMADTFVQSLVDLHAVDTTSGELASFNKGAGYVRRQVDGWSNRYRQAHTEDVPDGESVMAWLDQRQPADAGACVIHNDWRFDNVVLDPDDLSRINAVLDWELATVGDPFMDLGSAMAYWVQPDDEAGMQAFRMQPSTAPGMPTRDEFVDEYCRRAGRERPDWLFYEVYGLFRLAGIAQQIWYRYYHGQTSNPAFAMFGPAVQFLIARCEKLIS